MASGKPHDPLHYTRRPGGSQPSKWVLESYQYFSGLNIHQPCKLQAKDRMLWKQPHCLQLQFPN